MKKQKWLAPIIEEIVLKFDKEMDAPCFGSVNTPSNKPTCGISAIASSCWNSGGTNPPPETL